MLLPEENSGDGRVEKQRTAGMAGMVVVGSVVREKKTIIEREVSVGKTNHALAV